MSQQPVTDNSPGSVLFPEYDTLYDLIAREVEGLTDEQLDFTSDQWEWAAWSIRNQLSHMASLLYRWSILRWGDQLFPNGEHGVDDVEGIARSDFDRRLDDNKYFDLPTILESLKGGIDLWRRVMTERNVGFLRSHTVIQDQSPQWVLMITAHSTGITPTGEPNKAFMTLEATIRHNYFEEITHLFNIQRLKRAQGLTAVVDTPRVGYWVLDGWDVSEA